MNIELDEVVVMDVSDEALERAASELAPRVVAVTTRPHNKRVPGPIGLG